MFPKPKKLTSKKIRHSAKGESCTLRIPGVCNHNPETVVLCHINSSSKGMGNKSHDIHAVYACSDCHDWLDHRIKTAHSQVWRDKEILRSLLETQDRMVQKGLIEVR